MSITWLTFKKFTLSNSLFFIIEGGPKKLHKVNDTIILQPYVIESCGFQQNVPKEISYVTKVNIW